MPKQAELHRPLTTLLSPLILANVARRVGITARALRCVGLLLQVNTNVHRVTMQDVADLLGCHYNTARDGINEAIAAQLIAPLRKRNGGLSVTFAAAGLLDRIKREESEARRAVLRHCLPKRPRAYNRKPAPALV